MRKSRNFISLNFLICCLLFYSHSIQAAYRSPFQSQLEIGSAIANKNIELLKEKIHIHVDKDFRNAEYLVEYTFRVNSQQALAPFLFFLPSEAMSFDTDLSVVLNGKSLKSSYYSSSEINLTDFLLPDFADEDAIALSYGDFGNEHSYIAHYSLEDLLYVHANLEEGIHKFQIKHTQSSWIDATNKIKKRSFRYSLSAAKAWRKFENIEIQLLLEDEDLKYQINLSEPSLEEDNRHYYTLKNLDKDFLAISFEPQLNFVQKTVLILLEKSKLLLAIIVFSLLGIEWKWIKQYRKKHPDLKYNTVAIIGSVILPILAVVIFGLVIIGLEELAGPDIESGGAYFSLILLILSYYWWLIILLLILVFLRADRIYKRNLVKTLNE